MRLRNTEVKTRQLFLLNDSKTKHLTVKSVVTNKTIFYNIKASVNTHLMTKIVNDKRLRICLAEKISIFNKTHQLTLRIRPFNIPLMLEDNQFFINSDFWLESDFIKLLAINFMIWHNKLERFALINICHPPKTFTAVINSVASQCLCHCQSLLTFHNGKYQTRVNMTDNGKRVSLLRHGINYASKKFYNTCLQLHP